MGRFGQSNMNQTLNFCADQSGRNQCTKGEQQLWYYCPNVYTVQTAGTMEDYQLGRMNMRDNLCFSCMSKIQDGHELCYVRYGTDRKDKEYWRNKRNTAFYEISLLGAPTTFWQTPGVDGMYQITFFLNSLGLYLFIQCSVHFNRSPYVR